MSNRIINLRIVDHLERIGGKDDVLGSEQLDVLAALHTAVDKAAETEALSQAVNESPERGPDSVLSRHPPLLSGTLCGDVVRAFPGCCLESSGEERLVAESTTDLGSSLELEAYDPVVPRVPVCRELCHLSDEQSEASLSRLHLVLHSVSHLVKSDEFSQAALEDVWISLCIWNCAQLGTASERSKDQRLFSSGKVESHSVSVDVRDECTGSHLVEGREV